MGFKCAGNDFIGFQENRHRDVLVVFAFIGVVKARCLNPSRASSAPGVLDLGCREWVVEETNDNVLERLCLCMVIMLTKVFDGPSGCLE